MSENLITIMSVRLEKEFTMVSNRTFHDSNLTIGARGLLAYLLCCPADWKIHTWQLANIYSGKKKGNKLDAVQAYMKELREEGYITYEKSRNSEGKWEHKYKVYPMKIKDFQKIFPQRDYPPVVEPPVVNPVINTSNELPNTELPKNNNKAVVVFECLKNEGSLSEKEKINITKRCSEERVKLALAYSKIEPPTTTLIRLIMWHCNEDVPPLADASKVKENPEECKKLVSSTIKKSESSTYIMEMLSKSVEFTPKANGEAIVIDYDTQGFKDKFNKAFKKCAFKMREKK